MTASVLGTEYSISLDVDPATYKDLDGKFGYCDMTAKKIVLVNLLKVEEWKDEEESARIAQQKATLRHEVIHAYLRESGLLGSSSAAESWAMNEEMVDWIALQFPKILITFNEINAL